MTYPLHQNPISHPSRDTCIHRKKILINRNTFPYSVFSGSITNLWEKLRPFGEYCFGAEGHHEVRQDLFGLDLPSSCPVSCSYLSQFPPPPTHTHTDIFCKFTPFSSLWLNCQLHQRPWRRGRKIKEWENGDDSRWLRESVIYESSIYKLEIVQNMISDAAGKLFVLHGFT